MNKSMFKVLSSVVLSSVLLAGCGSSATTSVMDPAKQKAPSDFNATGFPIVKKPITMTMFADRSPADGPFKDMPMFQAYAKMTNINMKFNDVDQASFDEKKSLILGSNNLPDVFFKAKLTPLEVVKYGTSGELIPLEGLIKKYAPNIQALFNQYPDVKQASTAPDGHIYALPDIVTLLAARTDKIWLNKTMLAGVNMNVPSTTDELYNVLKAFKAKYPNDTPLSARTLTDLVNHLGGAWGLTQQMGYNISVNNDKVHIWTADDNYKQLLMYLHKLYQENLLDHQIFTQTTAQFIAKMQSGNVGLFTNQTADTFGKVANQYEGIAPFKGPNGDQTYTVNPIAREFGTFAISSTNKNPEAAIRWVDYFFGDKGSIFFRYGVEGKTFNYVNGVPTYSDSVKNLKKGIGDIVPYPGGATPEWINDKNSTTIDPPKVQAASDKIKPYLPKKVYSAPLFDGNTVGEVNNLQTDIDTFVQEQSAKFITGDQSFSNWNSYVSQLKGMGIDKLQQYYQDAFDKQYKK